MGTQSPYLFLIPLLLGFALGWTSAFTAAYARRWEERRGRMATAVLRNVLGIPLWIAGYVLAWRAPTPLLAVPGTAAAVAGGLLVAAGSVPVIWGHLLLGWRSHVPSVRDTLVRHGLYARVRHPIYSGGFLILTGLALLRPTVAVVLAGAAAAGGLIVQARLEERDLVERLPAYRAYMVEVPRFFPRLGQKGRQASAGDGSAGRP